MPHLQLARWMRHRGHGATHDDLVIASGARCTTIQFNQVNGRLRARLVLPHRRRYLTFSGPIGGARGVVSTRAVGFARYLRWAFGARIDFVPTRIRTMPLEIFLRARVRLHANNLLSLWLKTHSEGVVWRWRPGRIPPP